ncbi:hypothetical protein ABBQ32_005436 [Trebouxia sp. C0010 RCD-2024]
MASPSSGKPDDETVATAYRLLRDAVSTQAVSKEFILLCKHVRDHKDAKVLGVQATNTIKQLSLLEFQAQRHLLADQANAEDQAMYEARQAQLDHDIETANVELDKSRVILQAARQEKKQKLQYEEKREKCVQFPKRSKTEAEIAAVHQEIETLQTETEQAVQEYAVHGKRFAVLIRFVDELEASLNPDEMHDMDRSRASFTDQSDRDSSGRSVQD